MKNIVLLGMIAVTLSAYSSTMAEGIPQGAQIPSQEKQTFSIKSAEKYFAEKRWEEALKAYEHISPSLKGEDLDKANDRLGDIHFFLGHYKKSSVIYALVGKSVLARSATFLDQSSKFMDKGDFRKAQSVLNKSNVLTALSNLIQAKMYLVGALPTGDIDKYDANIRPLVEEVKQKNSDYLFIYHGVLTKKGFNLNVNKYNAEIDKLSKIKSDITEIAKKFEKYVAKDSTKTK